MTASEPDAPESEGTPRYGDGQAAAASGVPLPSLRVLQAAGALRAAKAAKAYGGFRRMWREADVLKAAIAQALGEHFAWNIRLTATVMAKVQPGLWGMVIDCALSESETRHPKARESTLIIADALDWRVELIDRKFLFFAIPEAFAGMVPGTASGQRALLLGVVTKDGFSGPSWQLATPKGRKLARETLGEEGARQIERLYRLALATHGNCLSKATINLGMQVRAAWRRLHGLESRFVQEAVRIGKGGL